MKKKLTLLSTGLCLAALLISGCGDKKAEAPKKETASPSVVKVAEAKQPISYEKAYAPVIEAAIDALSKGDDGDTPDEFMGLLEYSKSFGFEKAYNNTGFVLRDISGDDVPELILSNKTTDPYEAMIYALYSLEGGKPKLLASGYYRNAYYLLKDNRIYNRGSGGAAISIHGLYKLDFNGQALNCDSYYFTDMNANNHQIEFYKNSFGKFDASISQKITEQEFERSTEGLNSQIMPFNVTPFAQYQSDSKGNAQQEVSVAIKPAQAVVGDVSDFIRFDAYNGPTDTGIEVAIVFNHPLKEFKLNKLTYVDKGDDKIHFDTQTLYANHDLRMPLVSRVAIPGSIPQYGISFKDVNGKQHQYAIEMSGEDGRLLLTKY